MDRPTTDYIFRSSGWGWCYHLGEQGVGLLPEAADCDVYPEAEDIVLNGVFVAPDRLAGQPISLSVWPAFPEQRFCFTRLDRAHVGAIKREGPMLVADVVMSQSAASRLLQILVVGGAVEVTLATEPDDDSQEIVVKLSIEVIDAGPEVAG